MESDLIKIATQSGPAVVVIAIVLYVSVVYILPAVREALAAHQAAIRAITADHKEAQQGIVAAFNATLDKFIAQADKSAQLVMQKIGADVTEIRGDMDRIANAVEDLRRTGNTAPWPKLDPPSNPGTAKKE